MLTDRFSFDAAFGATSQFSSSRVTTNTRAGDSLNTRLSETTRFDLLSTWAIPMFGFHYYMGPPSSASTEEY
jgi:hypothetical protein